jgi:hypothetical protein
MMYPQSRNGFPRHVGANMKLDASKQKLTAPEMQSLIWMLDKEQDVFATGWRVGAEMVTCLRVSVRE